MERELSINPRSRLLKEIIRPEDALLVWCARKCPEEERAEQIRRLIREGIDWPYLIEASSRHGLSPLLYKYFESNPVEGVPKDILDRLRGRFRNNILWNLARTRELLRLLDLFNQEGIQAIPYKGPVLSMIAYGDLSLRQFDDLDIFVRRDQVKRVMDLLSNEGYPVDFTLTPRQEGFYLRSKCEYSLFHQATRIFLEIQWEVLPRYFFVPMETGDLFTRLRPVALSGKEVMTFCPEDLMIILCIHGGKHGWERLAWICDLANLIEVHREMDWEDILRQAGEMRIERMVLLGFFLATDLTGVELPERVIRKFETDSGIMKFVSRIYGRIFQNAFPSDGFFENLFFTLGLREHWMDKVRYCIDLGLTPTVGDWQYVSLPDSLFPLYYLIRPFRLVLTYGPRLFKKMIKGNR